jgi:hypothetical protein
LVLVVVMMMTTFVSIGDAALHCAALLAWSALVVVVAPGKGGIGGISVVMKDRYKCSV